MTALAAGPEAYPFRDHPTLAQIWGITGMPKTFNAFDADAATGLSENRYRIFTAGVLRELIARGCDEAVARQACRDRDADFKGCFRQRMTQAEAVHAVFGDQLPGMAGR